MIIVDVETTGVHPEKHALLSIGAVDFSHPERQFYAECQIWDGAEVMQEALSINGFTEENICDPKKKSQKEIIEEFYAFVQGCEEHTFAGENPSFDRDFLKASVKRENISWIIPHRTIDLHTLGYTHFLTQNLAAPTKNKRTAINLDFILTLVGLPQEPKPHNALTGAQMEAEVFSRLLYGKNLLKEFAQYPIPEVLKK